MQPQLQMMRPPYSEQSHQNNQSFIEDISKSLEHPSSNNEEGATKNTSNVGSVEITNFYNPKRKRKEKTKDQSAASKESADVASSIPQPESPAVNEKKQTDTGKSGDSSRSHHTNHDSVPLLTNEQMLEIATKQLPVEERIVFVSKQLLGPGRNGFSVRASAMQRMKRQRARQIGSGGEEEQLKKNTFNPRLAKRLHSEMTQALQFTNMMTGVLKSIMVEIDPQNPLLSISHCHPPVNNPETFQSPSDVPNKTILSPSLKEKPSTDFETTVVDRADCPGVNAKEGKVLLSNVRVIHIFFGDLPLHCFTTGSTLRKRHTTEAIDPGLLASITDGDEKLTKKEVSHRLFELLRWRTLEVGDHVAAKVNSQELWILGRVVNKWISPGLSFKQTKELSEVSRFTM